MDTSASRSASSTYGNYDTGAATHSLPPSPPAALRAKTRKYQIMYLDDAEQLVELNPTAPATPAFEDAFGALGHGAILQTAHGNVAVEDVLPGDKIRTADGRYETLLWRGMMTVATGSDEINQRSGTLIRVTSDALGPSRPCPDLILGPRARLFHQATNARTLTGSDAAFIPARDFIDGDQFIALRPAAPVNVYQLGFARHESVNVNGIEIESLHPGTAHSLGLRGNILAEYLSLFPHKRNLEHFGIMRHPRLRLSDLELLAHG